MDHFRYCVDLVGIEHVAFGPDTFFGSHIGLHHAMSDRFGKDYGVGDANINEYVGKLSNEYEKAYYSGIIHERRAKATLVKGGLQTYEHLTHAMECFERAEAIRPAGNDDAILRWNECARVINRNGLRPHTVSAGDTIE